MSSSLSRQTLIGAALLAASVALALLYAQNQWDLTLGFALDWLAR